jgi:hypothetical protein
MGAALREGLASVRRDGGQLNPPAGPRRRGAQRQDEAGGGIGRIAGPDRGPHGRPARGRSLSESHPPGSDRHTRQGSWRLPDGEAGRDHVGSQAPTEDIPVG